MKVLGNTTSKIEDKIDKHIEDGPNILEELKYFRKELKKIHEKVDNNVFIYYLLFMITYSLYRKTIS